MAYTTQGDENTSTRTRSAAYYFQVVVIDVGGRLYSIPKQALISQSPVFEGMFDVSNNGAGEGASDEKPIVLEGYKSDEFECLLKVLYPQPLDPSPPALSPVEWVRVLKLSTIWQMEKIRDVAIEQLSECALTPIEKIQYSREYRVSKWLVEGVTELASDLADYEVKDLATALGWETTALILAIREKVRPKALEATDWAQGWICWNCDNDLHIGPTGAVSCILDCRTRTWLKPRNSPDAISAPGKVPQDLILAFFGEEVKSLQT
ncbi:hypothetical protein BKA70DRAFT_272563 [Coprinopsis sp. MPI-PUGE-AT-0042]|nr:hypothetical protein BKA70DRAFT_272563 [Coprinopsis sp. MPI-PUGE-AT-0042]